jgi:hypothetical protein
MKKIDLVLVVTLIVITMVGCAKRDTEIVSEEIKPEYAQIGSKEILVKKYETNRPTFERILFRGDTRFSSSVIYIYHHSHFQDSSDEVFDILASWLERDGYQITEVLKDYNDHYYYRYNLNHSDYPNKKVYLEIMKHSLIVQGEIYIENSELVIPDRLNESLIEHMDVLRNLHYDFGKNYSFKDDFISEFEINCSPKEFIASLNEAGLINDSEDSISYSFSNRHGVNYWIIWLGYKLDNTYQDGYIKVYPDHVEMSGGFELEKDSDYDSSLRFKFMMTISKHLVDPTILNMDKAYVKYLQK